MTCTVGMAVVFFGGLGVMIALSQEMPTPPSVDGVPAATAAAEEEQEGGDDDTPTAPEGEGKATPAETAP